MRTRGAAIAALVLALPASAQDSTLATRAPIRVCAGGDVTLGTNLDTAWARRGALRLRREFDMSAEPASLLAPLRPLFADADVVLVNVETAIGAGAVDKPKCGAGSRNCYAFRAPVSAAAAIRALGADSARVVGTVANNHARDAGNDGVPVTARHLRTAGVLVTGMDTLATPVRLPSGDTIGVLGFYTSADTPDLRNLAAVRRHVARAAGRFSAVVVTAHQGSEGAGAQRTRDATETFLETIDRGNPVAFARAAIESGAALVVNHGPHVLRAAEWFGDRLVLYSLGNLVTYGPFNTAEPLNRGVVACVELSGRNVARAELRSTMQRAAGVVSRDSSQRAWRLIDSLGVLDFPRTGARVGPGGELLRRHP